jgi:galactokinase
MLVKPMQPRAIALFRATFHGPPKSAASAPGSVDLLGGYTADHGGPVLSIATEPRASVAAATAEPGTLDLAGAHVRWPDVVRGVLRELSALGASVGGVRVAAASDLPPGVPADAALAVATAKALAGLYRVPLTPRQVAGVAFRGGQTGGLERRVVMAHTLAALARSDHALLVESASSEARSVRCRARLLLVDTGAGPAVDRRADCEAAVLRLRVELPELVWLASWPAAWLARLKRALPQPLRSRATHIVSETARARFGAELLAAGRLKRFGELLTESHESCRKLFEASTRQADLVVATALKAGALGARLADGGAEGTVVVLLGKGEAKVAQAVRRAYAKRFGSDVVIRAVRPGPGARTEPVGRARSR